jgi:hypothetical protein
MSRGEVRRDSGAGERVPAGEARGDDGRPDAPPARRERQLEDWIADAPPVAQSRRRYDDWFATPDADADPGPGRERAGAGAAVALAPEPVDADPLGDRAVRVLSGERRTVTIRGRGAERYAAPVRSARERRPERRYERSGFRPDRAAMWAIVLGIMLIVVAAASAHGATLHAVARLH